MQKTLGINMNLSRTLYLFLYVWWNFIEDGHGAEVFRDCTRELYDRVVRFEYLYYEGYWMYPYNKLRNHGPSYHYTEKEFCELKINISVIHYSYYSKIKGHVASFYPLYLNHFQIVQMT